MSLNKNFAVIFPGQGSQQVGMLSDLAGSFPLVAEVFGQASDALGYDLWELTQNNPADKLNQTEFTQPALLAASYAIWKIFKSQSKTLPKVLAGHSLGEYTALVAAESLQFTDAIKLVAARGKFMQEAQPNGVGAMAAVLGMDNDKIAAVLKTIEQSATKVVEIANLNAIGQTVIAGSKSEVLLAIDQLKRNGAKLVKLLDVSVPSHCSLMQPAAERLLKVLDSISFSAPKIPVIHNYSLESYTTLADIKNALYQQLISPVRWVETIDAVYRMGVDTVYEFGPGSVLTKLCKRINENVTAHTVHTSIDINNLLN